MNSCRETTLTYPSSHLLAIQDTIVAKSFGYAAAGMVFAPRPNHDPLPDEATFLKQLDCAIRRVPIFIGYTRDEGTGFVPLFNHIDASKRPRFEGSLPEFISKAWFQDQAKQLYRQIRQSGPREEPWFYVFEISPSQSPWGAAHTVELPFILGDWEAWKQAPMLHGEGMEETVQSVGDEVKKLWVAFAKGEDVGRREFATDDKVRGGSEVGFVEYVRSYGVATLSCNWVSDFGGDFAIPFQEALSPALTNDLVLRPSFMQDSCCKLQLLHLQRQGWPNKASALHNCVRTNLPSPRIHPASAGLAETGSSKRHLPTRDTAAMAGFFEQFVAFGTDSGTSVYCLLHLITNKPA